jgi:hypothetical protein
MTPRVCGGSFFNGCSAVSYFSTRVGSIIGAGRLSFRVRDGSGRFPAAVAAVTLFNWAPCFLFGGGVWSVRFVDVGVVARSVVVVRLGFTHTLVFVWCV